jgi:hypothetical protein
MTRHPGHYTTSTEVPADLESIRVTFFPDENYVHNIYFTRTDGSVFDLSGLSPSYTAPYYPEGRSETLKLDGRRIVGIELRNQILGDLREDFIAATFYLAF